MELQHELSTAWLLKLCSFIFWGWSYVWCAKNAPKQNPEWCSRVVTLLHGSVATVAGLWQCSVTTISQYTLTRCTFACTLALMEITNPLLQTRWLLRSGGYGQTIPFFIIEITYLLMFLFLRGPFCTYLIYKILASDILDMDEKIVSVALYLVSLVLIYEILSYVTYKYRNKIESFRGFANEVGIVLNDMP